MELEDRITIQTPEGLTLEMTLAGLGSRAAAAVIDALIKAAVLLAVLLFAWFVTGVADLDGSALITAFVAVAVFVLFFVYDIAFETLSSGKTPGKRASGIRVVTTEGGPIRFSSSAIRNIIRVVDLLPGMYFIGIIAIVSTSNNQRLGDLAAGTVVVRDRRPDTGSKDYASSLRATEPTGPRWDVSGVSPDDVAVARQFLERRHDLTPEVRTRIAAQIADPLRARVFGPTGEIGAERFLERLVAEKADRD